jgi:integrase
VPVHSSSGPALTRAKGETLTDLTLSIPFATTWTSCEVIAGSGLVAPNHYGRPLDLSTWRRRIWKPAAKRAGVDATPYDLRRTYCSLLAHEGRSAPYIAANMGHSLTDTQKHYAHVIEDARLAPARTENDIRPRYARQPSRHLTVVG